MTARPTDHGRASPWSHRARSSTCLDARWAIREVRTHVATKNYGFARRFEEFEDDDGIFRNRVRAGERWETFTRAQREPR